MSCFSKWVTAATLSPWWLLITACKISAPEHICILISHQLPVRHSALFLFFFFKLFQTENKLHFSRDRGVIIWAFRTSHSLRVSDVLFHTSLVAYSCIETSVLRMAWHTLYSTRAVMECLVMLNGNLRETCQEKEKRKEKPLLCMVKSLHDLAYWGRQAHCAQ